MSNREKVIKGLEHCAKWRDCKGCPYFSLLYFEQVDGELIGYKCKCLTEALALLKEQEAVEPINSYGTFRCGNCKNIVGYNDSHGRGYQNNFCSKCGKAVKWV